MTVPAPLAEIIDDFAALPPRARLELLLEFAEGLPELPPRYGDHPERLERVPECQTPLFVAVELSPEPDPRVELFFSVPREAPTTRGFAGILHAGLNGQSPNTVLGVPPNVLDRMHLAEVVSPLRMRGMGAMLRRIQNQVREGIDPAARWAARAAGLG